LGPEIVLVSSESGLYFIWACSGTSLHFGWHRFALYSIKLTLAHLLWRFDMALGESAENWAVGQRIYNGWIQPPLPVVLKRRM
jgi:hypothetical protein